MPQFPNASNPSKSFDVVHVPPVKNFSTKFVYNFYVDDERLSAPRAIDSRGNRLPLSKIARYITLNWSAPSLSDFELQKQSVSKVDNSSEFSIRNQHEKILSEVDFFNSGFVSVVFADPTLVEKSSDNIETISRIQAHGVESMSAMAKAQLKDISTQSTKNDKKYTDALDELSKAYLQLADSPRNALGLRIYDDRGNAKDNDDFLRSIADNLSLNVRINSNVIPDVLGESNQKLNSGFRTLNSAYAASLNAAQYNSEGMFATPIFYDKNASNALKVPVQFVGYIIDRYRYSSKTSSFFLEETFYIEDPQTMGMDDTSVLYGETYVYSIRSIAAVRLLTYVQDSTNSSVGVYYVSSRTVSSSAECFEYIPPPEPNDIRFIFDYLKRSLHIVWDTPVNPQGDIKQFQIFRRSSIKHPFELIAQIGFDRTKLGPGTDGRYRTGELVDANNLLGTPADLKYLISDNDFAQYSFVDEDFTVDPELYISSDYIYALCSIDAHGIISNYSTQYQVTFDSYKNKIVTRTVCDAGSPRPYPNMNLRMDAFKDVLSLQGDSTKQVDVYFSPDYFRVKDSSGHVTDIVEAQYDSAPSKSYYVMQLINLDNQKTNLVQISIRDPERLTNSA
ncbi:MAG: hypothetical protein EBR82_00590 [Caulobacteraceae bacterium]|nr:hypothetical protein [Caulobacteraceae bacterium]